VKIVRAIRGVCRAAWNTNEQTSILAKPQKAVLKKIAKEAYFLLNWYDES